ncbi:hypothetical protein TGDOM2_363600 [Toxoplasma gondii GAB2-2007-GAL-DOM2]|uniref:Uncharacterized protein n=3 Tax=Toxoplasma gondii TaxID=5811 RepID=A0A086L0R3_TOXGO|nr:hypothetical protein TGDOM2_363600 [Toxoplasma gondii GAB2-2007-GAL-DOM2]KFG50231.1 hypothetical protein TGFOU_363600 [Toxoplasma gondii FOU]PUA92336.1 hypothetical protein TGBR9_363600 [Toxoplasma gondii TgCATBr9]
MVSEAFTSNGQALPSSVFTLTDNAIGENVFFLRRLAFFSENSSVQRLSAMLPTHNVEAVALLFKLIFSLSVTLHSPSFARFPATATARTDKKSLGETDTREAPPLLVCLYAVCKWDSEKRRREERSGE